MIQGSQSLATGFHNGIVRKTAYKGNAEESGCPSLVLSAFS